MEGKAGLHPGGRAGGLRAPGAGGSNPSPPVYGAGVRAAGADLWLLLGGSGVSPRGKSGSPGGPQKEALPTLVLTPPPGGPAPAPRPRPRALPPTPGPDVQLAEASAGGGVLRPQPALLPCQQLHCVREERAAAASGRAAARARQGERVRREGCAPPASRQLCPRAVRQARRPAAAAAVSAGAPPAAL